MSYPSDKLDCLYVRHPDSFPEVDDFLATVIRDKSDVVNFHVIHKADLKEALVEFFRSHDHYMAALIATRSSDFVLGDELVFFQMCDAGWPAICRVQPLIDWDYHDIWEFVQTHKLSYCTLYDQGYSSIGLQTNTKRNERLIDKEGSYTEPWLLKDPKDERMGRASSLMNK
jgi:FAD synthetase